MASSFKPFKEFEKLYDYKVSPTKFIQINKIIRFDDEKAVFINARKLENEIWYETKEGVRFPPDKIKNVIDTFEVIKKEHDEGNDLNYINMKFKNKHRFSLGRNTVLVIDMFKNKNIGNDSIFMRYQPEPGKPWESGASQSKGVTMPLESIPEIIAGLTKSIIKF